MSRVLVTGAGGALGGHLVKRLIEDGDEIYANDVKSVGEWWQEHEDVDMDHRDLSQHGAAESLFAHASPEIVYHLAANIGGMGYLSDSKNDHEVMLGNTRIDLNVFTAAKNSPCRRFVYASSACVYPEHKQTTTVPMPLRESDAYPAAPDLEYGWQKLFSERMLNALASPDFAPVAVRFHNVYGPYSTWDGGKEKAPAAMCRKIAEAKLAGRREIDVWGDGLATRSYLYVDDFVEGVARIAASDITDPINLGSDRSVSVNRLAMIAMEAADWECKINYIDGPQGVRGRNADLTMLKDAIGWEPRVSLEDGMAKTYSWISGEVSR